jgi:hypothetical protein
VSTPTTSIDRVINSSAGSKVRSAVRTLEILAGAAAVLTLLFWWNTRPRRRVAVAARNAQVHAELTDASRENYATALSGSSVFMDDTGQNPALVGVNGNGDGAAQQGLPLAARLPRALADTNVRAADATSAEHTVDGLASDDASPPDRPNPRPTPRRARAHLRARNVGDAVDPDQ